MALTIERLRNVDIPINVSNKPNNLNAFVNKLSPYNDSINLLEAIELIVGSGGAGSTDLSVTRDSTSVTVLSSTGTDATLQTATGSLAGVLTAADWTLLHSALQSISVGSGLTGDGSVGDPLDWPGIFVDGPLTGSGTSFFPLDILNNSITTAHIQTGTILFSDWNQNSASTGQVPQWNGTAWVAATAALPTGTTGDTLIHNGTTWIKVSTVRETITGIANVNITLAATPISYGRFELYKNGILQTYSDDFTRVGTLVTFTVSLTTSDKISIIYNV